MVTSYSKESLETLPSPSILELPSFSEILEDNKMLLKKVNSDYSLMIEDDNILPLLEAFAYRELHLRAMVNLKVKNMLPHYAKGADLDNFAWGFYGAIRRLQGAYPYAEFKFKLQGSESITIPDGTILTNAKGNRGRLIRSVRLNSVTSTVTEHVELLEMVESSEVELTKLDDYFNVKVEQKELFLNGALKESDERFLERSILSLNRPSTAGAKESYYFHIYNADVRVDTAYVYSPRAGVVGIVLDNYDGIEENVIEKIREVFRDEEIKPLTDKVEIEKATQVELTLEVEAKLYDLLKQREVEKLIYANFSEPFKINENLTYSDLIQRLHVAGIYSVRCLNVTEDVVTDALSRIIIKGVNCVFTQR